MRVTGTSRFALAIVLIGGACSGRTSPAPGARVGPALSAALVAAGDAREPWRCAAPDGPGLPSETLTVGARSWQLEGHALRLAGDGAGDVAIGVVADAAGSAPATLAALGRLRAKLDRADLVLSLGGMGATQAELAAAFAALATPPAWPLVAMPGDLEPVEAQGQAIAAVRAGGLPVLDGRLIQRIELPAATIAVIPGAGASSRLVAGPDGCSYRAADVSAIFAELTKRPGLRIVASAEPPRNTLHDAPAGELGLTAGAGHEIDIALHGPTTGPASPARAGRRDGAATQLTPGSSDALPRLPGFFRPSAGVLTIHGTGWTWQPIDDVN